ncbi:putative leucyl-tRNA synthetase [Corchorus olitorius]|uniref:Leucyl-tRNA synthetase n=1 Tax=Corchorus olitorius TaxID=93759 RepID=A0A1R3JUV2_9ROSI|nr:putative leucyl-tRNA synthetase [Corchorus olitorius]
MPSHGKPSQGKSGGMPSRIAKWWYTLKYRKAAVRSRSKMVLRSRRSRSGIMLMESKMVECLETAKRRTLGDRKRSRAHHQKRSHVHH